MSNSAQEVFDRKLTDHANKVIVYLNNLVKLVEQRPDLMGDGRAGKVCTHLNNQVGRAINNIEALVSRHVESLQPFDLSAPVQFEAPRHPGIVHQPAAPRFSTRGVPDDTGISFLDPENDDV